MKAAPLRVTVVGGGLAGLVTAYHLKTQAQGKKRQLHITLVEASSLLGGAIRTERIQDFLFEGGADSFVTDKPEGLDLVQRLGLEAELIPTNPHLRKSFIVVNSKLQRVPEGFYLMAPIKALPFLRSKLLSWRGKIRALAEPWIPPRADAGDESVASFVQRRFGREIMERCAQPMISGIYAANLEALSIQATMPKFPEYERDFGSVIRGLRKKTGEHTYQTAAGPRYGLFVSLRQGMGSLIRALSDSLQDVQFIFNTTVEGLEKTEPEGWTLRLRGGEFIQSDWVFLATPAYTTARLVESLIPKSSKFLHSIAYGSLAIACFGFERKQIRHLLNGMGFVVPLIENRPLLACSFLSQKFEGRAPNDQVSLRAFLGGPGRDTYFEKDDDELKTILLKELTELLSIQGAPRVSSIYRFPKNLPHYGLGHSNGIQQLDSEISQHSGLHIVGNYLCGVGIPDVIRRSIAVADAALESD